MTAVLLTPVDTQEKFVATIKSIQQEKAMLMVQAYPSRLSELIDRTLATQDQLVRAFIHHDTLYIWDESLHTFCRLRSLDKRATLEQIHQNSTAGLNEADVKNRCDLFGPNVITVRIPSNLYLLMSEILNPLYVFQLFAVIFLWFDEYYVYATAIFIILFSSAITSLIRVRRERVSLHNMVKYHNDITMKVQRQENGENLTKDVCGKELVPGDVIVIPQHGAQLACDVALVSGTCIVNESTLTGKSVPITKTPLPKAASKMQNVYSADLHKRHTLFCGTEVLQTRVCPGELVKGVVVRTAYHTAKGQLVHSILYPKPVDMKLLRDAYRFIGVLFGIAVCGFIYTVVTQALMGETIEDIFFNTIDLIQSLKSPTALPLAMTIGIIYAQHRLKQQRIRFISPLKINISGQVDVVASDKTGTLTEDGLDVATVMAVTPATDGTKTASFDSEVSPENVATGGTVRKEALTRERIKGKPSFLQLPIRNNNSMFQARNDKLAGGNSRPPKVAVDYTINVKNIKEDMEKKIRAIFLESQREENIKRRNQDRRKQYLQERLRKRRQGLSKSFKPPGGMNFGGQSHQSSFNGEYKIKELKPVLDKEPAPVPPNTSKEVLYSKTENTELFGDLEDIATNEVSENVTFAVLMKKLLVRELTELERVRILFHWISSQDLNAIIFPDNVLEDSPYGHLKALKENRSDYSTLFQRLCKAAGIYCKTIRGFLKCVGYFPDHSFKRNPSRFVGSWNAVYIDGEWRLIDTNWGARHISGDKLVYAYDEHYFLTNPNKMITSHFPEAPEWQLLHRPITLEQFEKAVQNWSHFYDFKLSHASHHTGMIATDRNGNVQIKLDVPLKDLRFSFQLEPRDQRQAGSTISGVATQANSKAIFDVRLPKNKDFILTLFARKTAETASEQLCIYQLYYPK
uniref:Probable cation-transporting ATPase 13A3 n=1 Tax=Phallusia mammillata TaxID=59560 RepID=A0A6F9D7C0_9ASCI|nr:probable cation-transporting ATPase 13A3 [Phallusia mammillata]